MKDLLRPSDVAKATSQSRSTIQRDIQSGILPARKKRGYKGRMGSLYITREDYEAYLKNHFTSLPLK